MRTPVPVVHRRYLIVRPIRADAQAVWVALDVQTRAEVALAYVPITQPAAFEAATGTLVVLRHPNLPAIGDCFTAAGSGVLVLELVSGDDLAARLEQQAGAFPFAQVRVWAGQLLDALDYLHTCRPPLIHGAISPQNIKLNQSGQAVLLGLGLGGAGPPSSHGSPFLAPEQIAGRAADTRSDLFALAATLYVLLTGQPPAPADARARAIAHGQADPLVRPRALNPKISPVFSAALIQALALDPERRPASARILHGQLAHDRAWRRWPVLAAAYVVLIALLVTGLFASRGLGGSPNTQPATAQAATSAASAPTSQPIPVETATSGVVASATAIVPTFTPTPPRPTALPAVQIDRIEPQEFSVTQLPAQLIVHGLNLGQVHTARLVADAHAPITVTIALVSPEQLTIEIAPQIELSGEASYQLELDGNVPAAPSIALHDFIERRFIQGILPAYQYTNQITSQGSEFVASIRAEPNTDSAPVGTAHNGDELDILRREPDGWYMARIRASTAATHIGVVGWIERWLVDNQGVPPAPDQALNFVGSIYNTATDAATQCGITYESLIYGSVQNNRGKGIAKAVIRVTAADGRSSFITTTGPGGLYEIGGLGCTTWKVRLVSIPGEKIQANIVTVKNLNGGRFTSAGVRFKLQK